MRGNTLKNSGTNLPRFFKADRIPPEGPSMLKKWFCGAKILLKAPFLHFPLVLIIFYSLYSCFGPTWVPVNIWSFPRKYPVSAT